jgi:hypothetical protein
LDEWNAEADTGLDPVERLTSTQFLPFAERWPNGMV